MSTEAPAAPVPQALVPVLGGKAVPATSPAQAHPETIYEVNVEIDPAIASEYDAWLPGHVDRLLALPGFLSAEILRRESFADGPLAGWHRRTILYRLASPQDLQDYLDQKAAQMRGEAVERFGDHIRFERRVLSHVMRQDSRSLAPAHCRNCDAISPGQYCAVCGQRSPVRVLTLWELIKEATDDLTHSDSRVWQTLWPLLFKPGQLTRDYLLGRRARYLPPFRLYLVLSVLCLVVMSLGGTPDGAPIHPDGRGAPDVANANPADRAEVEARLAEMQRAAEDLKAHGVPADAADTITRAIAAAATKAATKRGEQEVSFGGKERCTGIDLGSPGTTAKVEEICRKLGAEGGWQHFNEALIHNVPKMMFIFLPLIAFVSFLLYAFSGRYYVEHLLFFVHFHAFVFLAFTIEGLFSWIGQSYAPGKVVADLVVLVMVFYVPIYLYKAMRRLFGQGRALTVLKFLLLASSYLVCLLITFIGLIVYTGWTF